MRAFVFWYTSESGRQKWDGTRMKARFQPGGRGGGLAGSPGARLGGGQRVCGGVSRFASGCARLGVWESHARFQDPPQLKPAPPCGVDSRRGGFPMPRAGGPGRPSFVGRVEGRELPSGDSFPRLWGRVFSLPFWIGRAFFRWGSVPVVEAPPGSDCLSLPRGPLSSLARRMCFPWAPSRRPVSLGSVLAAA